MRKESTSDTSNENSQVSVSLKELFKSEVFLDDCQRSFANKNRNVKFESLDSEALV